MCENGLARTHLAKYLHAKVVGCCGLVGITKGPTVSAGNLLLSGNTSLSAEVAKRVDGRGGRGWID